VYAANLANVNWQDGVGNILNSWLESGETNTSAASVYWVNLGSLTIPANGTLTIYQVIYGTSVTCMNGTNTGAEPLYTGTYGQYDNGATVFQTLYDNFAGSSLNPNLWSTYAKGSASYSVSNGLSLTTSASNDVMHVYSKNTLANTGNMIAEAKWKTVGSGSQCVGVCWQTTVPSSGGDNGFQNGYRFEWEGYASVWRLIKDVSGTGTVLNNPSGSVSTPFILGAWWSSASPYENLYYNYTSIDTATDNSITVTNSYLDLAGEEYDGSGTQVVQWVRVRITPPNNVPPTTSASPLQSTTQINISEVGSEASPGYPIFQRSIQSAKSLTYNAVEASSDKTFVANVAFTLNQVSSDFAPAFRRYEISSQSVLVANVTFGLRETASESGSVAAATLTQTSLTILAWTATIPLLETSSESASVVSVAITLTETSGIVLSYLVTVPLLELSTEQAVQAVYSMTQTATESGAPAAYSATEASSEMNRLSNVTFTLTQTSTEAGSSSVYSPVETSAENFLVANVQFTVSQVSSESTASAVYSATETSGENLLVTNITFSLMETASESTFISNVTVPLAEVSYESLVVFTGVYLLEAANMQASPAVYSIAETSTDALLVANVSFSLPAQASTETGLPAATSPAEASAQNVSVTNITFTLSQASTESGASASYSPTQSSAETGNAAAYSPVQISAQNLFTANVTFTLLETGSQGLSYSATIPLSELGAQTGAPATFNITETSTESLAITNIAFTLSEATSEQAFTTTVSMIEAVQEFAANLTVSTVQYATVSPGPATVNPTETGFETSLTAAATILESATQGTMLVQLQYPEIIITVDGKIVLRISSPTSTNPEYIWIG
jgi:hypothetical protein